ncbi:MAG: ankyrin repeat domain-containing protein [Alphaproteobacteria bacterium]|nr:ankyrin repeat domain-containing protein [Alphaproteobacteria bacterium]
MSLPFRRAILRWPAALLLVGVLAGGHASPAQAVDYSETWQLCGALAVEHPDPAQVQEHLAQGASPDGPCEVWGEREVSRGGRATRRVPGLLAIPLLPFLLLEGVANRPHKETVRDELDVPPLILAVQAGSPEAVRLLLDAGAYPNVALEARRLPLEMAVSLPDSRAKRAMVDLLLDAGAVARPTFLAWTATKPGQLEALCRLGVDPNATEGFDPPALSLAVSMHNLEATEALLACGAWPDVPDVEGVFPIDAALEAPDLALFELLLAWGADLEARDVRGRTALARAVFNQDRDHVALLLARGADLTAVNAAGDQPIHMALDGSDTRILSDLIEAGADPNAVDGRGDPALVRVLRDHKAWLVEILLEQGATISEPVLAWLATSPAELEDQPWKRRYWKASVLLLLEHGLTIEPWLLQEVVQLGDVVFAAQVFALDTQSARRTYLRLVPRALRASVNMTTLVIAEARRRPPSR